jgi:hypothetical protein
VPQTSGTSKAPFTQKKPPETRDILPSQAMKIYDEEFKHPGMLIEDGDFRQGLPETPMPLDEDVDPWDAIELNEEAKKRML